MKKHVHCPVNGWDCPYYSNHPIPCECTLENPMEECDDFATFWDEDDDYICRGKCLGCCTCGHSNQFTLDDVSSCNCCEEYGYYTPDKEVI